MSTPLLCVTVAAPTLAELRKRRDAAADADLVELRLDSVQDPDVAGALAGRRTPVIVTCRPVWEGGQFRGSEAERKAMLQEALERGADYVDVEFRAGFDDVIRAQHGRRIVLSFHDFNGVPADLREKVRAMRSLEPEVMKIAVTAHSLCDGLPLLEFGQPGQATSDSVVIAMGGAGLPSRVLAARFGSRWTYAGDAHAPGQVPAAQMIQEYHFRQLSRATQVYGIVGNPLSHSLSPVMHNAVFEAIGLDAVYLPLQASSADDFLAFAEAMDIRGASVTIPYKVDLFQRIDDPGAVSRDVGALNTLKREGGRWVGLNSDVIGFAASLQERGIPLDGIRAAILGAGGAARAVAVALRDHAASVTVYARNPSRAQDVARLVPNGHAAPLPVTAGSWDLLVNATPVGMYPNVNETAFPNGVFDGQFVYDLVYNPPETRFLREAAAAGCTTIDGLDMLVTQAAHQSKWWLERDVPVQVMRRAALARLGHLQEVA